MIRFKKPDDMPRGKGTVREVFMDKKKVGNIKRDAAFNFYYETEGDRSRGPLCRAIDEVKLSIGERRDEPRED